MNETEELRMVESLETIVHNNASLVAQWATVFSLFDLERGEEVLELRGETKTIKLKIPYKSLYQYNGAQNFIEQKKREGYTVQEKIS